MVEKILDLESKQDKQRALDAALVHIEKSFGKGSIMKLGEASARLNVEVIPTGAIALDLALGVGGVPRGRVTEIYGAGVGRQEHPGPAHHRRGAAHGRRRRLHRCRACARP